MLWSGYLSLIFFLRNPKQEPCVLLPFQKASEVCQRDKEQGRERSQHCQAGSHNTWLVSAPVNTTSGLPLAQKKKGKGLCKLREESHGDHRQYEVQVYLPAVRALQRYWPEMQLQEGSELECPEVTGLNSQIGEGRVLSFPGPSGLCFRRVQLVMSENTNIFHWGLDFSNRTYSSACTTHNL